MKHLAALSVLFIACAGAHAQKVDLDRFRFSVENYRLPTHYVAPDDRTYAINVVRSPMARTMISESEVAAGVRVAGYREVDAEDASVHIEVALGNLMFEHSQVVAHPQVVKNKEGKVADTTWTYSVDAFFRSAGGYTIAGPGSKAFNGSASVNPFLQTSTGGASQYRGVRESGNTGGVVRHSTQTFRSRREAERAFLLNRDGVLASLYSDFIAATVRSAAARANTLYGYVPVREEQVLWILDYKGHPEYRAQQDAIAAVRAVTAGIHAHNAREPFARDLAGVMEYFRTLPQKYTGNDERSRKLRYSAYYNRATLYIALDRPDLAAEEAHKLVLNAFDTKDGKKLAERARELDARLAFHRMDGHYARR
jgi:hypothetical protein